IKGVRTIYRQSKGENPFWALISIRRLILRLHVRQKHRRTTQSDGRRARPRSGSRQQPRLAFWLRACALHPAYSVRGSPSRSTVSNSPPGWSGLAMCPSMPASEQRSRSPLLACAVSPTIGTWLITHLFFLRRELVHRRPAE